MEERFFLAILVINEVNLHAAMKKTRDLKPLPDRVRIKIGSRKNRWVG